MIKKIIHMSYKMYKNKDYIASYNLLQLFIERNPDLVKFFKFNLYKLKKILDSDKNWLQPSAYISKNNTICNNIINQLWCGFEYDAIKNFKESINKFTDKELKMIGKICSNYAKSYAVDTKFFEETIANYLSDQSFAYNIIYLIINNKKDEAYLSYKQHYKTVNNAFFYDVLNYYFIKKEIPELSAMNYFNKIMSLSNNEKIIKINAHNKFSIDNICVKNIRYERNNELISVIMPVYNGERTIEYSINSILKQSYSNLELIIVDDNSNDRTQEIIKKFQKIDSRVKYIKMYDNIGCYACRNEGLKNAVGKFITTQDCDDWSHPYRLKYEYDFLMQNSNYLGCYVSMLRVSHNLDLVIKDNNIKKLCPVSFMFRRSLVDIIGVWNNVRFGGDSEFIKRIQSIFGCGSIEHIEKNKVLLLAYADDNSLTCKSDSSISSLHIPTSPRYLYRDYYGFVHKYYVFNNKFRNIPIRALKCNKTDNYDIFFISDVNSDGFIGSYPIIKKLSEYKKIAILHIYSDPDCIKCIDENFYMFCVKNNIDIISSGDKISTTNLVILNKNIFSNCIKLLPSVFTKNIYVVDGENMQLFIDKILKNKNYQIHLIKDKNWHNIFNDY